MKFIDLFAGIGGFHSGLSQAGHKCVGWVEYDKYARQSYQAMYETEGLYSGKDIREVTADELPYADIWTFGSPCQDISLAGKRSGLSGQKSSLFFEVIRLLHEKDGGRRNLPGCLWKTFVTCYQAMEDLISLECSLKWTRSATMSNGMFLTLPSSHPKIVSGSTLSAILEGNTPSKYFLSTPRASKFLSQL